MTFARLLLPLLAVAGSVVGEFQPIEVKGSKFFYKNGTQFYMKGVAYQQDIAAAGGANDKDGAYSDPLANEKNCKRDVPNLKELGTNTIRAYAIDPSADHSVCMKLLEDAGIYVVADLSEPRLSINRDNPEWNAKLFTRYQKVVDELAQYPNVIGFFAGNEVSNNKSNTGASAYVKAAVRDTKKYIKDNKNISRWLGVGYAANDDDEIRDQMADYFNCGATEESIDYFGYNIYSWCGDSSIQTSGFDKQAKFYEDYSVPVFFAEYGCNQVPGGAAGRKFTETEALYSDSMTHVFSGGIIYMYFQEANDFGLVKVSQGELTKMKDFDALKEQATKADPKRLHMSDYKPAGKQRECPAVDDIWRASDSLPPTPDKGLCDCMVKSSTCVPKSDTSPKKFGDIFGYICGSDKALCAGISADPSTGVFGAYNMCDDSAKLAHVLDAYHTKQKKSADSCDFDGAATTQQASTEASCSPALASASDLNKHAATATSPAGGKASSSDDSVAVHGVSITRAFSVGDFALGLYMIAALGAGAAAIVL
ncbi:glucanosyltransferase domain-containing protein [Hirsutella rhossiliensis]|uniref:1,3-beta-glucanosyltransferase n=1 Tax=Hirsutella rhossiliensis TaxID=111463 RepID=A0A9P8MNT4_9HYPO|nr:glucanosyltransferase domain-containing protein [Hirsutella rhossiliensis]KAH0958883.1 glucanosyltransferase domain-containing protein [Hirsutella rhossiliensis]